MRIKPGENIMTGLSEGSGRRSEPELQRGFHAICFRLHMAAVREGLVSVGVVMIVKDNCDDMERINGYPQYN